MKKIYSHVLGFPRIGRDRSFKKVTEAFWKKDVSSQTLESMHQSIMLSNWASQKHIDFIPVLDFSPYDAVLDMSVRLGVIPSRFSHLSGWEQYFAMARGTDTFMACEMKKWFDTNYHYIVPELSSQSVFKVSPFGFESISHAKKAISTNALPVLIGPMTFLYLSKSIDHSNKWNLIDLLTEAYINLIRLMPDSEWIQLDEPIFSLELSDEQKQKALTVYQLFAKHLPSKKIMLTQYFGSIGDELDLLTQLPVSGLHVDASSYSEQIVDFSKNLKKEQILSVGIVNGRNIWKNDLNRSLDYLKSIQSHHDLIWVSSSCSLLHVPYTLQDEPALAFKDHMAFAYEKLEELHGLTQALNGDSHWISLQKQTIRSFKNEVWELTDDKVQRSVSFDERKKIQQQHLSLPDLPTTTIGSFPQDSEVREKRKQYKEGQLKEKEYQSFIEDKIQKVIQLQETLDLDVLVHGEFERNDMVEFFAEKLQGFVITQKGWVQSYGTRLVKAPIIAGDIVWEKPMTVQTIAYAQSLSKKPVKGMLTGPVTLLSWSFVREDQPRSMTAKQLAFAVKQEVMALEKEGLQVIQVDEPGLREGLPLKKKEWESYLKWAIQVFKWTVSEVSAKTQIHTHMCYAEFSDILPAILALDVDVITLEMARAGYEFLSCHYPKQIGPGSYDIHSPRIPDVSEFEASILKMLSYVPASQLWINPDCGLKTRSLPEVKAALANMVSATKKVRSQIAFQKTKEEVLKK